MLAEKLSNLPDQSGVYHYFDKNGHLLYIGKAKSLKNRVRSYFRLKPEVGPASNLSPRIYKMICETAHMEYILVDTEHDALILENSLIKQLKPKYNILLRDDKTFPYIYVNQSDEYPRPEITRKIIRGKNITYYGPFSIGARDILDSLYDLYPLVQKFSCLKGKKICLFYQIKKCIGACERKMEPEEYKGILEEALSLITKKTTLLKKLQTKMMALSEEMRFEEAAVVRDRIEKIKRIEDASQVDLAKLEDLDVFAIKTERNKAVLIKLFMRQGKIVSSQHKLFRINEKFDEAEAYKRLILNYYTEALPLAPKQILVPQTIEDQEEVEEHISEILSKKVEILTPQRGSKQKLIELALKNAQEILTLESNKKQEEIEPKLQELLQLDSVPSRIEIFDASHLGGVAKVGGMVVYENDTFVKEDYRHYNLNERDEYGQMREMLMRRIESFEKNPPPDLWVIDGGKGQLNLATELIQSSGTNLNIIAISKEKIDAKAHRAKGKAKDILHTQVEMFRLPETDKRLQFVQKLRDEAHRFAITFHRKQKTAKDKEVTLLKAKGIGEAKIKKLLDYFGNFSNIHDATTEELSEVLNLKDAEAIREIKPQ